MSPPRKTAAEWLAQAKSLYGTNNDAALSCLERVIELEPNNAEAWFYKASVFYYGNRPEDSLAAFRKCAEIDGGSATSVNGIVSQLKKLRRLQEALDAADA